jgi:hypothetical protein
MPITCTSCRPGQVNSATNRVARKWLLRVCWASIEPRSAEAIDKRGLYCKPKKETSDRRDYENDFAQDFACLKTSRLWCMSRLVRKVFGTVKRSCRRELPVDKVWPELAAAPVISPSLTSGCAKPNLSSLCPVASHHPCAVTGGVAHGT